MIYGGSSNRMCAEAEKSTWYENADKSLPNKTSKADVLASYLLNQGSSPKVK